MTCRKCQYEFCWLCFGDWRGHRSCNKSPDAEDAERRATDAQTELEYYMFYYHRYESHRNAMKIADQQRRTARDRAHELMQKFGVNAQDVGFMAAATEQLLKNRNMLQYSYVYAYCLRDGRIRTSEKNLFEYLQNDLEHHTDGLSALYERDLAEITDYQAFVKWKEQVANYTRVCKKFLDNFVEGVIEKSLVVPAGQELSEDERFYYVQLEQLDCMGLSDRSLTVPLLNKFDGRVDAVVNSLFG